MERKVKLTKAEAAAYKGRATYEWEGHIIESDDCDNFNGGYPWHCDTLFKGRTFRTLRGIRKAIQLKVEGKLTPMQLDWCEEE